VNPAGDGLANGTWEKDKRILSKLYHNAPGDPNHTYRLQKPAGDFWIFHDFDGSWGDKVGKLWFVVGRYGDVADNGTKKRRDTLEIVRHSDGRIDYVVDPSNHYARYSYTTINSRYYISQIDVWEGSGTSDPNTLIRSVEYTYRDSGTGHADTGNSGDLILVESKTRKTSDTTSLGISWHTHYRYWPGGYTGAKPGIRHELKSVFRYRDMLAAAAAPLTPAQVIAANDATANDYRSCWFEYETDHRVSSENVEFGTSCCGGGAAGKYRYSYTDNPTPPSNRKGWAIETKEVRPDGSVKHITINKYGQPLVMALDDPNNPITNLVFRVWKYVWDNNNGQLIAIYHPSACSFYNTSTHTVTLEDTGEVTRFRYYSSNEWYMPKLVKRYGGSDPNGRIDPNEGTMLAYYTWETRPAGFDYRDTRVWLKKFYKYTGTVSEETEPTSNPNATLVSEQSFEYWNDANDLDGDANTVEPTDRIKTLTITFPATPNSENGSNVQPAIKYHFDRWGKLRFSRDAEGSVSYRAYDMRNGRWAMAVTDIDASTYGGLPSEVKTPTNTDVLGLSNAD
ncbi:MAG: hypothetical protein KDA99_28730, partial [Planctomycetales bacterium]|nr:hypothetical protein [Planctomycetales bacterium]